MHNAKRDLLVLFNQHLMTQEAINHEVAKLHSILYLCENVNNIASAHEVNDINKHKIFKTFYRVKNILKQQDLKPFVFLNCKN